MPRLPGRSVRDDLLRILTAMATSKTCDGRPIFDARIHSALLAEKVRNPGFYRRYREQVIEPRRAIMLQVLRRGVETGELAAGLDLGIAQEMLVAPLILRLIRMNPDESLPDGYVEGVLDTVLAGIAGTTGSGAAPPVSRPAAAACRRRGGE
jgi:hypothetical protein